ncbi:malonyl-CoA decarboxylase [Spiribacter pallidus]|uniref:malonyl-CoA decarboxylase n=1 Tax=Spiribacter pallidus TaxID=1987936 RepID=UPI00349F1501
MAIVNVGFLQDLLHTITQRDSRAMRRARQRGLPDSAADLIDACRTLMDSDGEASSIALAQRALDIYKSLATDEKKAFFQSLARDFSADRVAIEQAYGAWQSHHDEATLGQLFAACEPARQELLRRLNLPAGGTLELVRMRQTLLEVMGDDPELRAVDADFQHLFGSWFNRGFLVLRRIDWQTPAAILEKIIAYEAVHAISDWQDLRRRLDQRDRRCFAFFHPATGDEPLIFVEVALEPAIPERVQAILDEDTDGAADDGPLTTAAFYGISNCQRGLRGISFGNFLIKQVVTELSRELPDLRQFVTLSPMPGFRRWLDELRRAEPARLDAETLATLDRLDDPDWVDDPSTQETLAGPLRGLAAHYLGVAKRRGNTPLDPVANFHLGNGARLERINFLGDRSAKGLETAAGMMVNYLYVPDEIERNHERFTADGHITQSSNVRDLSRRARKMIQENPAP